MRLVDFIFSQSFIMGLTLIGKAEWVVIKASDDNEDEEDQTNQSRFHLP